MRLPVVEFAAANVRRPDRGALALVAAILVFSACILSLPLSDTARRAALARFQLSGWPLAAWMAFQPLPSMYNFENRWEVVRAPGGEECPSPVEGFINHHVYNRIVLFDWRLRLRRCPLPARVYFRSTYRGTTVETTYRIDSGPADHGMVVTPVENP